jgi:hypothetical protein
MFFLTMPDFTVAAERTTPEDIEVNSPEDLEKVGTGVLIRLYNQAVPSSPVKKFPDRATAVKRTFPLLESLAKEGPLVEEAGSDWASGMETLPPPSDTPGEAQEEEESAGQTEQKEDDVATATKKRRGSRGATKGKQKVSSGKTNGKRGRTASYAGAKLFRVGDENPCRTGGLRAQSWDLIRNGMTYESYLEKGGRPQELAFNVRQGRVKVEYPSKKSAE